MSKITVDACLKLIESASAACKTVPVTPPAPADPQSAASPNWDAMANSFAALSAAFSWGSLLLAAFAILSAIAWGYIVTKQAEAEAREVSKSCANERAQKIADEKISAWLRDEAPGIIRKHVDNLQNASLGGDGDGEAADEMGEAAG